MALYEATVTIYVVAENALEAKLAASNAEVDFQAWDVWTADVIDAAWDDLLPFGATDDKKCREYVADPNAHAGEG